MSILTNLKRCTKSDVIKNKLIEDITRYKIYYETMYDTLCPLFEESSTWNNVKDYSINEREISLTIGVSNSIEFIYNAMFGCSNINEDFNTTVTIKNSIFRIFEDSVIKLEIAYINETTVKLILSDKNKEEHNLLYNLVETKDSYIEMSIKIGICSRLNEITKEYDSFVEGYINTVKKELGLRPTRLFYKYLQDEIIIITPEMEKWYK